MNSAATEHLESGAPRDLALALVTEMGAALTARSEAEHLYTAAAMGSFGAVCWGVAALDASRYSGRPFFSRPGAVAAVGIAVVTILVVLKIYREHRRYAEIKDDLAAILRNLACRREELVPKQMLRPAGAGAYYSIALVVGAALAGICFCLAVS